MLLSIPLVVFSVCCTRSFLLSHDRSDPALPPFLSRHVSHNLVPRIPCNDQAQNVVIPIMKVALLGMVANVFFHHLTMVVLGMGVFGAGLALSLTGMFLLLTLITYTRTSRCEHTPRWSSPFSPPEGARGELKKSGLRWFASCLNMRSVVTSWTD